MLYDICTGTLLYIGVSLAFGNTFDGTFFALALFFSLLPDIDFIPYVLLKKRLGLVSHHIIHFPLFFLLAGAVLAWFSPYLGTLFLLCITNHFIHDTLPGMSGTPLGLRWFYPFSTTSWVLQGRRFKAISDADRADRLETRRQTWLSADRRNLLWEIASRLEPMDAIGWTMVATSSISLAWFILR